MRLAIPIGRGDLRVTILHLIYCMMPILDVMVIALLPLHDAMNGARRAILTVLHRATAQHPLLALAVMLVDVAAGVAGTPVVVEVLRRSPSVVPLARPLGCLGLC
jgi:hypothetical protein